MGKPLIALLALALAGGAWAALPDPPGRPRLASPMELAAAPGAPGQAARCLTPAAGLPESMMGRGGAEAGSAWVASGPGKWVNTEGVEVPTLEDAPGVLPVFGFHEVMPRAEEVLGARPRAVVLEVWKNLAPGWCVHRLEARLDGQPAAAADLDETGRLTVPIPADLPPGVHGVTVFVEACCGRPADFVRPSPVRVGHHQVFTWNDSPPGMTIVAGGTWRLRLAFSGQRLPSATDPLAWEVRDPLTGGPLAVVVNRVDPVPGSRDLLLTFDPPLPPTEVVLALWWRGQESVARYLPPHRAAPAGTPLGSSP